MVHKPLPKHPGNPLEPSTQVRNCCLCRVLLGKARQTAKLSCRKREVPWHGSVGQLGRALRRNVVGQDSGTIQAC